MDSKLIVPLAALSHPHQTDTLRRRQFLNHLRSILSVLHVYIYCSRHYSTSPYLFYFLFFLKKTCHWMGSQFVYSSGSGMKDASCKFIWLSVKTHITPQTLSLRFYWITYKKTTVFVSVYDTIKSCLTRSSQKGLTYLKKYCNDAKVLCILAFPGIGLYYVRNALMVLNCAEITWNSMKQVILPRFAPQVLFVCMSFPHCSVLWKVIFRLSKDPHNNLKRGL